MIRIDQVPMPGRLFWFALFPHASVGEETYLTIQDWIDFYESLLDWLLDRNIQIERHHHFTAACLPPPYDFELRMRWG